MLKTQRLLDLLRLQICSDARAASNLAEALDFIVELVGPNGSEMMDWRSEKEKRS